MAFNLADALKDVPDLGTGREQIEYIPLSQLDSDPNNFYQLTKLDELADNIATCGLQQPIRVRIHPDDSSRYMIVSGHRRRAALELLAAEDPERWQEVPCIVERDAVSPALQQLRVIYGNSNTRVLTAAEISEQVVQVEKLLYQLKEEGHEFPGRMRDHVAQVVQVSKSKISRLKVIREKLSPCWFRRFQNNQLKEAPAYALAQIVPEYQIAIFNGLDAENRLGCIREEDVPKYVQRLEKIEQLKCGKSGGFPCANIKQKMNQAARVHTYSTCNCAKCCGKCPDLMTCKNACSRMAEKIKKMKAEAREARRQEKAAKQEAERPEIEQIQKLWMRYGYLREKSGKTVREVYNAADIYCSLNDEKNALNLESGYAKITTTTKLPFNYSCYLSDIRRLIAIADLFGCSLDYLLCRTDEPEPKKKDVPSSGTIWHPISEEPPVGVDLIWVDARGYSDTGEYRGGQQIEMACTIPWEEARWWAMPPTEG